MDAIRYSEQAQRVGKVANLVIFLGIIGNVLSIFALTLSQGLARRGYGFGYIFLGLLMIGFGYGIRFRYKHCLHATIVLFVLLSCNFLFRFFVQHTSYLMLRFFLCGWVTYRLMRSISSMKTLIETDTFPDRTNRFLGFFTKNRHL